MVITQLIGILFYCFLMYSRVILIASITSCSTARSFYSMTVKLYSECLCDAKIAPQLNATATISKLKPSKISSEEGAEKPLIRERVARWGRVTNAITIAKFRDNGLPTYANATIEELWRQQAFHHLPGVVDLLYGKYADHYFTKTEKGKNARVSLVLLLKGQRKPKKEVYHNGILGIGINKTHQPHIIYHMMFRPKEGTAPLQVPYILYPEYEKKVEKTKKNDKKELKACKVKKSSKYYNKKENTFIIQYLPPKKSPYKLIELYIHPRKEFKP